MNNTIEQHDPMPIIEVLEKVREGCTMQMNWLDENGYSSESDDYVVALAFFEDYIEGIKQKEVECNIVNIALAKYECEKSK
jgi:hypothetical protein